MKITEINRAHVLLASFVLSALVMFFYETLKETIFHGKLTSWESHIMTIVVTATISTGVSAWVCGLVIKINELLHSVKDQQTRSIYEHQKKKELEAVTEKLRENEERFLTLIEAIPDGVFLKDDKSRWLIVNESAKRLFKLHSIPWYGKTDMDLAELQPELRAAYETCFLDDKKTWENGELTLFAESTIDENNQRHDFEVRKVPMYSEHGQRKALVIIGRDITERNYFEKSLRIAATVFESQEGTIITDANSIILRVNRSFTTITGYIPEEAIGQTPHLLSSGRHDKNFYTAMWNRINQVGTWEGEIWNRRKSGEVYPEYLTITAVKDGDETVINYVATLVDISRSKAASDEIKNLAFYDPLTHLANRRLLLDRLKQALVTTARTGNNGTLLFLDLDHFKTLNDTLGHDVGDLYLQQVAERLKGCVRDGDTVARLGGDEFVVLLDHLSEKELDAATQIKVIAEKIREVINQPFILATHEYSGTTSIGATMFSDQEYTHEDLLKHADIAMYQAKLAGRNTLRFFDPAMQDAINIRADLESELRKAINHHQFQLYYQIQVDHLGRALGAEVLIRWVHPERGIISPAEFIPLAEETGLILSIGQWVLDVTCEQLKQWQQNVLTRDLILAVNVSAKQFRQTGFVQQVQATVQHYGIDPTKLKLELTESMLIDNIQDVIATMNALKAIGIKFSLDDFGTGYSSLQYLKTLPLDQLKIDQSFVRDIVTDVHDKTIVLTVIIMAHSLGLDVIAEGVETEEQKQFLLENDCRHYQGYLFSEPLPISEFEALLVKS